MDETRDLPNVSQIDFDSRDSDNLKYLSTNCQELSTLPDCGNSLGKQRDKCRTALHRNRFSDDDTDSEGTMTPLLIKLNLFSSYCNTYWKS